MHATPRESCLTAEDRFSTESSREKPSIHHKSKSSSHRTRPLKVRSSPDFLKSGRSERIRTSDPCLPKTVLYQAELHSDRGGGRSVLARHLQGFQSRGSPIFCIALTRGDVPVSARDRVRRTGVVRDIPLRLSRSTM